MADVVAGVVADLWLGHRRGPAVVEDGVVVPADVAAPVGSDTVIPGIVDRHVHLGLVDPSAFAGGLVVEVHDLGWVPSQAVEWRSDPPAGVTVRIAGPFHTAPGGYPSGRAWAPEESVRAVRDADDARAAVAEAVSIRPRSSLARATRPTTGVDFLKIALQDRMALLDDETLGALVAAAHDAGLPAVVHAEGAGQAARAIDAGADVLAHTPWTEVLDEDALARGLDVTWISTLAIQTGRGRRNALENIWRFRGLGGRVVYGTDLGNGPALPGVNEEEILALGEAGLAGDDLLTAVTGVGGGDALPLGRALAAPLPLPGTAAQLVAWLRAARRLDPTGGQ